jgi:type VI protein secretion system component VasF
VLADTVVEDESEERAELDDQARLERDGTDTSARRLALWLIVALAAAVILVWLAYQLS